MITFIVFIDKYFRNMYFIKNIFKYNFKNIEFIIICENFLVFFRIFLKF